MPDTTIPPPRFVEGEFRIGRVLKFTFSVLSQHFPKFFAVTAVLYLPTLLVKQATDESSSAMAVALGFLGILLAFISGMFSQAVVLHAAFQQMRRRPVSLIESVRVALRRVLSVVVLSFVEVFLI